MVTDQALISELEAIAVEQIRRGMRFPQKRKEKIKKYETAYNNDSEKPARGKFNVPPPVLGGYIDTLKAKLNESVRIKYGKQEEADYKKAAKVTSMWERDSAASRGKWRMKDMHGKHKAAFAGFAVFFNMSESVPHYRNVHRNVDHHKFYCEPKKGNDLEEHRFLGEMGVWRTKAELEAGVSNEIYIESQVTKLKAFNPGDPSSKTNEAIIPGQADKWKSLGLDANEEYTGDDVFALTNHFLEHKGARYYLLIDYTTGIAVRVEKLEDLVPKDSETDKPLWPYAAWHTHPDTENFWSKSPADDIWPVAEAIRIIFNLALENLKKRVRQKRAVDPTIFPDTSEILDDITEVVEASDSIPEGKSLGAGVYEFKTEDNTQIIVSMIGFMNAFTGENTGITQGAKGAAEDTKATIYVGNVQEVANRMNLYSDYYKQCHADLGKRYFVGLKDNLTEGYFVKILGTTGEGWEEMTKDDVNPLRDFDIVVSSDDDSKQNQIALARKSEAIKNALVNPAVAAQYSPKWLAAENLRMGGYEETDIKEALDRDAYGDKELLSEAAEAIQQILDGEEPKPNRGANEGFVMKIINYADDNSEDLEDDEYEKLYAYAYQHLDIVAKNVAKRAMLVAAMSGVSPDQFNNANVLDGLNKRIGGGLPPMTPGNPGGGAPVGGGAPGGGAPAPMG